MKLRLSIVPLLAFILVGCAALGLESAKTFNERVAAAQIAVTTVRTTSNTLLRDRKISSDDHENVEKQADSANDAIGIARSLSATDPAGADNKINSALTIVTSLENYLRSKQ